MPEQPIVPPKHYFRLKGQRAEDLLHDLANQMFLADWCFPNPVLPSGKELCDLLVVFDDTVIIWQAKSLKLGRNGKLNQSEVEKNLRQLAGARRQLFDLKTPLILRNSRRAEEAFDPDSIKDVFLISVLLGDTPDFQTIATSIKEHQCHVFTREFTSLVLNELDTIADFCAYLREKERIRAHTSSLILRGGEQELLGIFLLNGQSLARLEGRTSVYVDHGTWESLQRRPEYQAKQEADEISYLWDEIVDRAHTGDSTEYERIARELARPSRFERRCLAQGFFDGHVTAHENVSAVGNFRRVVVAEYATICFLYAGDQVSRERRRILLESVCFVARGTYSQHKIVLGIATESVIREESSLDYCLLDIPEWGPEQQREMKRLQEQAGILTRTTRHESSWTDYPETS